MTTYTHIPMAGRCGRLLTLKDDTPYCFRLREEWSKISEEDMKDDFYQEHVLPQMCDENETCQCHAIGGGVVWSQVMGSMPASGDAYWEMYLTDMGDYEREIEDRENDRYVRQEEQMRRRIMTQDVSLSSGETYR